MAMSYSLNAARTAAGLEPKVKLKPIKYERSTSSFSVNCAAYSSSDSDDTNNTIHTKSRSHTPSMSASSNRLMARRHSSLPPPKHTNRSRSQDSDDELSNKAHLVKTKMSSFWHQVKYGWTAKSKATFRSSSPIVLLGRFYDHKDHSVSDDSSTSPNTSFRMRPLTGHEVTVGNYEEFKRSFDSFFWFTYRREFTKMEGSSYTSDCGWGCMLRSGQMLLAEGLRKHFLGKDWSYHRRQKSGEELFHRQIITWCSDKLDVHCPFSVHQLVNAGNKVGKKAGDWYGPASVAHILKAAMEEGSKMNPLLAQLKVYVAQDCTIYKGDVKELCKETRRRTSGPKFEESSEHSSVEEPLIWRPVIVLVPVRLGGESLNHIYTSGVQYFLQLNRCIGVIGGRPKHSLYFTGYQDEHLIYLDPHYCQQCVDTDKKDFDLSSFHCRTPQKMNIKNMDPSCTIGFYFRTEAQFDEFCTLFNDEMAPNRNTPIFVIQEGKLEYEGSSDDDRVQVDCVLRIPHYDEDGNVLNHSNDDFVML